MRCALVLCLAALVGLSTAGWQYGVGGYSGHQQMPVKYYVPSAMSGHQHMYVPQPQVVNLDLDYSPSIAFPGTMHTVHNDGATNSEFSSRSGSVNAEDNNNDEETIIVEPG